MESYFMQGVLGIVDQTLAGNLKPVDFCKWFDRLVDIHGADYVGTEIAGSNRAEEVKKLVDDCFEKVGNRG